MVFMLAVAGQVLGEQYEVISPNGKLKAVVEVGEKVSYSVTFNGKTILSPSCMNMTMDQQIFGWDSKVAKVSRQTIYETLTPVVRQKSAQIENHCHVLHLKFKQSFDLEFRAYDDGVAYRFITRLKGDVTVHSETVEYRFPADWPVWFPEESSMFTHMEREYLYLKMGQIASPRFCSMPALVDAEGGIKALMTEADVVDYPGFYLKKDEVSSTAFVGQFPHYALADTMRNDRSVPVIRTADYLAKTQGKRSFPWRVLIVTEQDKDLIASQMIYKLAQPLALKETEWIKPGKVAWDWWNANNLYGVDFEAGINTATYKAYIDFAADFGLEYIILDEGWYPLGDLLTVVPEIDMPELLRYGREKGVGLILWVVWKTLEDQWEAAFTQFESWGVKGIKVDFMQRDDQYMVNYYWRVAEEAATRHLLVDFHGSYKPTGLRRAYPNVITREGVRGLEHNKWGENANPENGLVIPFTRMVAGPLDYTPGGMLNSQKANFKPVWNRPHTQGTRCHQMAMYVVYESPLQMLADSPSNYRREQECMAFLSSVPTVWDETVVLEAQVSDYVLIARRSGDVWYVGGMTDWTPRDLAVDFSFLGSGAWKAQIWQDGPNAHRAGVDFAQKQMDVNPSSKENFYLAPGGGFVMRITQ
jgi:alpha-glucosidase